MDNFTLESLSKEVSNTIWAYNSENIVNSFNQQIKELLSDKNIMVDEDTTLLIGYVVGTVIKMSVELSSSIAALTLEKAGLIEPVHTPEI